MIIGKTLRKRKQLRSTTGIIPVTVETSAELAGRMVTRGIIANHSDGDPFIRVVRSMAEIVSYLDLVVIPEEAACEVVLTMERQSCPGNLFNPSVLVSSRFLERSN